MITLTDHLLAVAPNMDRTFRAQIEDNVKPSADYAILADVRARHGFARVAVPLLTPPSANQKLDKAVVKSYGLTLAHFRTVLPAADGHRRLSVNACPNAGHCTRVCVLDNGNGRYDSVQRARAWRSDFLARHADSFARVLAYELTRAVSKYGQILFRPNVNSDVRWEVILPSLTDGLIPGVMSYGYSKLPTTLEADGWLGAAYRVAYSWNERADAVAVAEFLARGGAVAVVTGRHKGAGVLTSFPFASSPSSPVADADVTDEWILTDGPIIGDLSAKGKARTLIGKSRFVVEVAGMSAIGQAVSVIVAGLGMAGIHAVAARLTKRG